MTAPAWERTDALGNPMTEAEFRDALAELIATTPLGLPAAYADGECDTCGTDGPVRIAPEGLACDDCYEADPRPYDPSDEYERQDEGWGW